MRKIKKINIFALVLAAVLMAAALAALLLLRNLDSIVKTAIEQYGTEAAGTPVRVDNVTLNLQEGLGTVRELIVTNPAGFTNEPIFRLGDISLDLEPRSLATDLPVVEEIRIAEPRFLYEMDQKGQTNLGVIRKNIEQFSAAREPREPPGSGTPARLRVERLRIEGGVGILDLTAIGDRRREIQLPPITLTDIGGRDGITPANLARQVLAAMVKELEKAAARQGVEEEVRDRMQEEAGELKEKLEKKAGEGIKKFFDR